MFFVIISEISMAAICTISQYRCGARECVWKAALKPLPVIGSGRAPNPSKQLAESVCSQLLLGVSVFSSVMWEQSVRATMS